jgi:hypothetical protein
VGNDVYPVDKYSGTYYKPDVIKGMLDRQF